ncbi:MAG: hypothetical protein ACUVUH_00175 [bacterium]
MLLFMLFSMSTIINADTEQLIQATQSVLIEMEIPIAKFMEKQIESKMIDLPVCELNHYIIENLPDENPGWKNARYHLVIEISEVDSTKSELSVNAVFERYGVPNAYLLIPDEWVIVPSNGSMEKQIIDAITQKIQNQNGGEK